MAVYLPSLHKDNGAGSLSADGNTSSIFYEKGLTISNDVLLPIQTKVTNYFIDGVASDVNFSISSNDVLTLGATNGIQLASNLNTGAYSITGNASTSTLASNVDVSLTNSGTAYSLALIDPDAGSSQVRSPVNNINTNNLMFVPSTSQLYMYGPSNSSFTFYQPSQMNFTQGVNNSNFTADAVQLNGGGGGGSQTQINIANIQLSTNSPSAVSTWTANSLSVATVNGNLNGNASTSTVSAKSTIATASANASYTLLVATANSGNLPILGSGSDLNYNPVSQTLSVKNMIVSGTETQTGVITTNVLRTDIMIQQVSYLSAQVNTLANFAALLTLGTFIMTTFSNSTIVNSIVTINLPALPNDGSYDGYTFQLRKLNGGVNQTTQNWTITAPTAIIIPNGNTLNSGSGGANSSSSPSSFVQRYTIVTSGGVGYYVGCNN